VNLDNVRRDDWIIGGLALVLIIDLVSFPWFSLGGGSVGGISLPSFDLSGTDAPDGWLGILAVIALIALIADLAIERFSPQTQIPEIGGSRTMTRFVLAAAAAGFMALKFLFHIGHIGDLGWGFWLGALLAIGLVFLAMQARAGSSGTSIRPTRTSTPVSGGPAAGGPPAGSTTPPAPAPPASTPTGGSSEPPPSAPPPGP
jgi:hypothetical protein